MKLSNPRCIVKSDAMVGECPTWDERLQVLYWVDIQSKLLHRHNPNTGENNVFFLPEIVPAVALSETDGDLLLCMRKGLARFQTKESVFTAFDTIEKNQADNRFNDAKVDPRGRFWAGTMNAIHWEKSDGALYNFSNVLTSQLVQPNVCCSNGMGWSPDLRIMYFTDSFRYTVWQFDYDVDTGALRNRRPFYSLDPQKGVFPDGLTVDAEGYVWSAHVGKGQIVRYNPKGKAEYVLQMPVPRATSCTFGGKDLTTLYITTARETLTQKQLDDAPDSGSVFAVETQVKGLLTYRVNMRKFIS